ncbi:S-adenosyl-L-methionine-dependent methyltransferase [Ascobolus immersus RN42]|uniref:S-adenosyl-L-methionine-dependent methyltransferase n=1 Tax=Ascobolus immersus RN42 TaxID=1160509 RepID=A0A3N4HJF1_ASCIM|nr:S-adenosyl-L-methionine-dependent methyltransferase [Ascobolus immersus RN42]
MPAQETVHTVPEEHLDIEVEPQLEIGDDDNASLSSRETFDSDTTSLTSSVFNFVYENGRRYTSQRSRGAKSAEYMLPNDDTEQERLDITHHMYNVMYGGKLHFAPLKHPKTALDLGCGTGIWAIDFGDLYPECKVLGIDLSPIQPSWTPPNVRFEVDNFEDEWLYSEKFDYIHGRSLTGSVKDWPKLLKACYDHLAPGGWVEFCEGDIVNAYSEDNSLRGTPFERYHNALAEAGTKSGVPLDLIPQYGDFLAAAGFTNITKQVGKSPVGGWAKDPYYKEVGLIVHHIGMTGFEAYGMAMFTRVLGWETKKAKALIDECVALLENVGKKKVHMIYPQYIYYAQKPFDPETKAKVEAKTDAKVEAATVKSE